MKKVITFSLLFLVFIFFASQKSYARDSCENRNSSCPVDQYPNCQKAVGECSPPACIVSMYWLDERGVYVFDCAYPEEVPPPPSPERNTCGWDTSGIPVDNCIIPYVAHREGDPSSGGDYSCICKIPQPEPEPFPQDKCPVCPNKYVWNYGYKACQNVNNTTEYIDPTSYIDCGSEPCAPGCGCGTDACQQKAVPLGPGDGEGGSIRTAIGDIDPRNLQGFIQQLLNLALGVAGGIAFLLMLFGAFQIMTSSGNPEKMKSGSELITSALTGLLFIIFSIFLLKLIGVEILQIPGFGQ